MTLDEFHTAMLELSLRRQQRFAAQPGEMLIAIMRGLLAGYLFLFDIAIWFGVAAEWMGRT